MMREILFRGKRMNNGEWVYGSYAYQYGCHEILLEECESEYGFDHYHVDHETVGQFTGLTDKNGKKIFEGDILKIARKSDGIGTYYIPPLDYPVNVAVKWDLTGWTWETLCKDKYYIHFPDAWCHFECEVIGNIHDNPELLKEDTYEENSDTV